VIRNFYSPSISRTTTGVLLLTIILAGILVRLPGLAEPSFDVRDADTAAMARNFYEGSMNILYPQIDWRGRSPGYVESEFPIYSWLMGGLYRIFGIHDWFGRGFNVGIYALTALLLFQFTRRLFGDGVALLTVLFYTVAPLSYVFTRVYKPDPLMALGSLAGIYYFWRWSEEGRWGFLALAAVGTSLAVVIKPTNLYLGLPLLYLCHRKFGWRLFREPLLWGFAAFVIVPSALWYHHAWNLWETYGNTFGVFGGWVKVGFPTGHLALSLGKHLLLRMLWEMATPVGLVLLLVGFLTKPPGRNYLLHWWAVGFGISVLIAAPGHVVHDYYQLPILFVTACWMAYGAAILWKWEKVSARWRPPIVTAACLSVVVVSSWVVTHNFRYFIHNAPVDMERVVFDEHVRELTEPGALVIFARPYRDRQALYQHRTQEGEYLECDPVDFYYSHRKGWSLDDRQASPELIETLRQRGAKYFATVFPGIFKRHPDLKEALARSYVPVEVTREWVIYRLNEQPALAAGGHPSAK
jgi:Dolichyl-phosphate-mannose-protein mannosyltransferase